MGVIHVVFVAFLADFELLFDTLFFVRCDQGLGIIVFTFSRGAMNGEDNISHINAFFRFILLIGLFNLCKIFSLPELIYPFGLLSLMSLLKFLLAERAFLQVSPLDPVFAQLPIRCLHKAPNHDAQHSTDVYEEHANDEIAKIEVLLLVEMVPHVEEVNKDEEGELRERLDPLVKARNVRVDQVWVQQEDQRAHRNQISFNCHSDRPVLHTYPSEQEASHQEEGRVDKDAETAPNLVVHVENAESTPHLPREGIIELVNHVYEHKDGQADTCCEKYEACKGLVVGSCTLQLKFVLECENGAQDYNQESCVEKHDDWFPEEYFTELLLAFFGGL